MHSSSFLLLFLFGLVVGSFLNVLIYRIPRNLRLSGRSLCPHCQKRIEWYDNIPLISFLRLGGRCRSCHSPIDWQYPLVELLTATLFVVAYVFSGIGEMRGIREVATLLYYWFVASSLIAIFFIDFRHRIIPDRIVFPMVVVTLMYFLLIHNSLFMIHLLSALGAFIFFLLLFFATKGLGMGLGDVKLSFVLGLFLGFPKIVVALYLAFLTGAIVSLILVVGGRKKLKDAIAFGPFMVAGSLSAFFLGDPILTFWLHAR